MATKKKGEHVGFRNGDLFCFHCGQSYPMNSPQPITILSAIMKQFGKDHTHRKKTWEEPQLDMSLSANERAMWWAGGNGETGTSSMVMWRQLMGRSHLKFNLNPNSIAHPSDPDDFRRCYLLLKCVPEWKNQLYVMKEVSGVWSKLVDHWDRLTDLLEAAMKTKLGSAPEMYDLMKSLGC